MDKARKYEITLVAIMFATWGSVFLDRMALLYLVPFIAPDLHLSHENIGYLTAATSVTWALSSFLFGALSDRYGRKIVLVPMVFLFSLLSWVSGTVTNFAQMLVTRGAMGAAEGPCWSVMSALVEESSHPSRRGRNMGVVVSAAAAIGLAVAPILTTQIAASLGWRVAFLVTGLPGLFCGLAIWRFVREPKPASDQPAARTMVSLADMLNLIRCRNVVLCCIGGTGFIAWLLIHSVFAPLYMTQVAGLPATSAGLLMGASGAGSLIVGMSGSAWSDRVGRRSVVMTMALLCAILPLLLLMPPLYHPLWLLAALLAATQGGQALAALTLALIPAESVPRHQAAAAIGLVNLTSELLGGTVAPILAGRLSGEFGLKAPLLLASAGALLTFFSALFLREKQADR